MEANMTCPVVITKEDDWFIAREITTDVASQGESIEEALSNLKEALELYYENTPVNENQQLFFFTTTLEVCV